LTRKERNSEDNEVFVGKVSEWERNRATAMSQMKNEKFSLSGTLGDCAVESGGWRGVNGGGFVGKTEGSGKKTGGLNDAREISAHGEKEVYLV
jgi:hypothetical protein